MLTQTEAKKTGDTIKRLAQHYAARMNSCEFATTLRGRRMPRDRYLGFLAVMYPSVVGFNRALIKSIAKVDHVRQSGFVKALAEQLQEEQAHNALWRHKLDAYGIDHETLYASLEEYLERFSTRELDRMTSDVLAALRSDLTNVAPGVFPDPLFPEPVLALYHHLWMTACYESIDYWEHFASQAGIEMVIYEVVSASVWPGVAGNPELEDGAVTLQWWKEHARQGSSAPGVRTDEEKHLELSQIALNRNPMSGTLRAQVAARAEDTMRLFAATLICQDFAALAFPIERYMKRKSA